MVVLLIFSDCQNFHPFWCSGLLRNLRVCFNSVFLFASSLNPAFWLQLYQIKMHAILLSTSYSIFILVQKSFSLAESNLPCALGHQFCCSFRRLTKDLIFSSPMFVFFSLFPGRALHFVAKAKTSFLDKVWKMSVVLLQCSFVSTFWHKLAFFPAFDRLCCFEFPENWAHCYLNSAKQRFLYV